MGWVERTNRRSALPKRLTSLPSTDLICSTAFQRSAKCFLEGYRNITFQKWYLEPLKRPREEVRADSSFCTLKCSRFVSNLNRPLRGSFAHEFRNQTGGHLPCGCILVSMMIIL